MVRAVLAVASGEAVYSASVARRIVDFFTSAHHAYAAQAFPQLTAREREILDLIAAGLGNHATTWRRQAPGAWPAGSTARYRTRTRPGRSRSRPARRCG